MRPILSSKLRILLSFISIAAIIGGFAVTWVLHIPTTQAKAAITHPGIDCSSGDFRCAEVFDSYKIFDHYVGHDEPSTLFYSNVPGSGNRMQYTFTLPVEPPAANPNQRGKAY